MADSGSVELSPLDAQARCASTIFTQQLARWSSSSIRFPRRRTIRRGAPRDLPERKNYEKSATPRLGGAVGFLKSGASFTLVRQPDRGRAAATTPSQF